MRGTLVQGAKGRVSLIDLATGKVEFISAGLQNGHSTVFQPGNPDLAVVIDQDLGANPGKDPGRLAVVDLRRKRVVATVEPEKGYLFSGHGCFSPDGKRFYLTETPDGFVKEGRVNIFDASSWASVAKHPSGHAQTHVVMTLQEGKTLAIGHYGMLPRTDMAVTHDGPLVYMDAASGKVIKKVSHKNEQCVMCHMDKTSADDLVVSTRIFRWRKGAELISREDNFPSPVVFVSAMGEKTVEAMPESLADDMRLNFTVKVHEAGDRVIVCHLLGGRITVWGLRDHRLKLVKEFGGERPVGVDQVPGTDFFLVTTSAAKGYVLEPKEFATVYVYDFGRDGVFPAAHIAVSSEKFVT